MRLLRYLHDETSRQQRFAVVGLFVLVAIAFVLSIRPHGDVSSFDSAYLSITRWLSNFFLQFAGVETRTLVDDFMPEIKLKKWMLLFLLFVWITKCESKQKLLYSTILIAIHFVFVAVYNAWGTSLAFKEYFDTATLSIPVTVTLLLMITVLYVWYKKHKDGFFKVSAFLDLNTGILKDEKRVLVFLYVYIVLSAFIFQYFDFEPWINFLFNTSKSILAILGYSATVEPFHLVGPTISIYMAKACLGFQTMLLFVAMVLLTGKKVRGRVPFLISGVIFLNLVNIMRFVLLFIHMNNNGGYAFQIDLHTLFNIAIYAVVFLLWIIWFECFVGKSKSKLENNK